MVARIVDGAKPQPLQEMTIARLLLFQPSYYPVQEWELVLLNPKVHVGPRKRHSFGRQLLIDLWPWKNGRRKVSLRACCGLGNTRARAAEGLVGC